MVRRSWTVRLRREIGEACAGPSDMSKHRRLDERENQTYRLVVLFLAYTGV
jgi:hypothetical protein